MKLNVLQSGNGEELLDWQATKKPLSQYSKITESVLVSNQKSSNTF